MTKDVFRGAGAVLLWILIVTQLAACSRDDDKEVNQQREAAARGGTGQIEVVIVPPEPTRDKDLRALVKGDVKRVSYRWFKNDMPVEGIDRDVLPRKYIEKGDTISVEVSAGNVEKSASVTIGNTPPGITSIRLNPGQVYRGVDITAEVEGEDPDGDEVEYLYRWMINDEEQTDVSAPVLEGDRLKRGDRVVLTVTPYDGEAYGEPFTADPVTVGNAPPMFVSAPPESFKTTMYTYQVEVEDPDGDRTRLWLEAAPEGMTIDQNGLIEWPVDASQTGTHRVKIIAEDGHDGRAYQEYTITISFQ